MRFGRWAGPMLRTHRAGKGPGGCGGVGLRFKEQKGPRRSPHPWSQKPGDLMRELSSLTGPEWVGQTPSAPLPLVPEGPSCLPLLISLASGAPILSGLHFSSPLSPPTSYQFTWGSLPSPCASASPTSSQQVPWL